VKLLAVWIALAGLGCASARGWRTTWVAVSACTPDDEPPGTLLVSVVDAGGLPMSGVIVQARVRNPLPIAVAVADATGRARLRVTPPSPTYELTAALPGFYATCVEEIRAIAGCTTELRLPMRVAGR
jgi:hypothetical protein